jgi:hypothetical protein
MEKDSIFNDWFSHKRKLTIWISIKVLIDLIFECVQCLTLNQYPSFPPNNNIY